MCVCAYWDALCVCVCVRVSFSECVRTKTMALRGVYGADVKGVTRRRFFIMRDK